MKIGLVGVGRWGKNILNTIMGIDDITLSCVTSNRENIRDLIPIDCSVYQKWDEMINHPNLEGIIISTPPKTHYLIAQNALLKGIPVLVEKPLTLNIQEALDLRRISESKKTLLMTEFTQIYNPKFTQLKKSLKLVGDIRKINTIASNFGPVRKDTPVLWDWGSHELSILISLLEEIPISIEARKIKEKVNILGEASSWDIVCKFKNKITSYTSISNIDKKIRKVTVIGTKGIIVLDDLGKYPLQFHKEKIIEEFPNMVGKEIYIEKKEKPLFVALTNFFNCIRNKEIRHWSLDLGVEVTELLTQCSKNF